MSKVTSTYELLQRYVMPCHTNLNVGEPYGVTVCKRCCGRHHLNSNLKLICRSSERYESWLIAYIFTAFAHAPDLTVILKLMMTGPSEAHKEVR